MMLNSALLHARSTAVVVHTRVSSVVAEAVVVEVNLSDTLLEVADHDGERAKSIRVNGASWVALVDWDDSVVATMPNQYTAI